MPPLPATDPAAAAPEIRRVLVLGGGVAGLLAALTLKKLHPALEVELIRGSGTGAQGPGEGTTATFPGHLFETLGISKEEFYREVQPTWKQGTRFLWGPREEFFHDFGIRYHRQFPGTSKPVGYFATGDCSNLSEAGALMERRKAFATGPLGRPLIKGQYGFHVDRRRLADCLAGLAARGGVILTDDTLERAEMAGGTVAALHFTSGARRTADLHVDASGSRAELIGKALGEPFESFSDRLFCDRAVIGGWERTDEPIEPFTTVETMNHGWCWQLEHETVLDRGYVFSSRFASDDEALAEFLAKNPRVTDGPHVVEFRSGRHARSWVGNVVAVGDAAGFVEPLAATALAQTVHACRWLAESLRVTGCRPDETTRSFHNRLVGIAWDEIRDFLAIHYKFNNRLDTPFWLHCREATPLGGREDFHRLYREVGPNPALLFHTLPERPHLHGVEDFLAMLVGMQVPHERPHLAAPAEREQFDRQRARLAAGAKHGATVRQALDAIRHPAWQWT
jgi:tryptophan halogenase